MLNIALPKGRLADKVCGLLSETGYENAVGDGGRKLEFSSSDQGARYLLVKPSDVPIYVEYGAADVGIVGKDILSEYHPNVYELLDLKLGFCRMCVAAREDYTENLERSLRVATSFPNIARDYYASLDRDIEIIRLNGSVELAPVLGLADVIVDLVESGKTLKDNNLHIIAEIMPVSARLIANTSAYAFKRAAIDEMINKLKGAIKND